MSCFSPKLCQIILIVNSYICFKMSKKKNQEWKSFCYLFFVLFSSLQLDILTHIWTNKIRYPVHNCKLFENLILRPQNVSKYKKNNNIFFANKLAEPIQFFVLFYSDNKQSQNYIPREYSASYSVAQRAVVCEKTFSESLCAALFSFMACLFTFREKALGLGCLLHSKSVLYKAWFGVSDTPRHVLQLGVMHFCLQLAVNLSRKSVKQVGIIVRIKQSKTPLCCTKKR